MTEQETKRIFETIAVEMDVDVFEVIEGFKKRDESIVRLVKFAMKIGQI